MDYCLTCPQLTGEGEERGGVQTRQNPLPPGTDAGTRLSWDFVLILLPNLIPNVASGTNCKQAKPLDVISTGLTFAVEPLQCEHLWDLISEVY